MPWEKPKEEQYADGSQEIRYNYYDDNKFTGITILITISSDVFDTFSLVMLNGIKSFKKKHPKIIPEEMGYMDKLQKCLKIGVLDNGAGPKSIYITDYQSVKDLPAGVKHTVYQRMQTLLNIIYILSEYYGFSRTDQNKLENLIQKSFTFLGAVTMAKSRIEDAKIFKSVAYFPDDKKSEKLKAKKLGEDAINLHSAINKLLAFASKKEFEILTQDEIEILSNKEKFIPLLKTEASWLIALDKEFPEAMKAFLNNQALPSDIQSYAKIHSVISSKAEKKEEQTSQNDRLKETTPLLAENVGGPPERKFKERAKQKQRAEPKPEPDNPDTDSCFTCTVS